MARGRRGRSRLNISPPPRSTPDGSPLASRSTEQHEAPKPDHGLDAVSPALCVQSHVSAKTTSSYAAIINPDEGDSLSYIQALILNGVQCRTLGPEDVAPEIAHWQSFVLCTVLGANPPLDVIERYVHKIWAAYEIDQVYLVRAGLFLVHFKNLEDQLDVVNKGVYYFARKPFIVKPWNAEMEINTEEICSLPIRVQLLTSLSKLGSSLSIPLKTDKYTRDKSMLKYARLLIDIPLKGSFPDYIDFANDKGVLIRQSVFHEWQPIKCLHCLMFGHQEEQYRKKQHVHQEWKVVTKPPPGPDSEGFMAIPPRQSAKAHTDAPRSATPTDCNRFIPLQDTAPDQIAPIRLSDHTPLMLQITVSPKPRPSFQFCDMWVKDSSFLSIIHKHLPKRIHNPLLQLQKYQTSVQRDLQTLNRGKYKDLREQQRTTRAALEHFQQALANDPTNDSLLQQEREAQRHYISIISSTLDITRQQCKVDWIKYGDAGTQFFYAKAKQRKLQTYVYSLRDDDGLQHQGFDAVSRVLQDYYSSLLGNPTLGAPLDPTVIAMGPILSLEQQQPLCAPFAKRDIKDAFFSILGIKSLGPDGFNSTFYKAAWDSNGPLLCAAIHHFFSTSHLPSYYGHTKLVLLPKTASPSNAREFRPVSCRLVFYKSIAKLLALRLKRVLPVLIQANQSAFVPEREILLNILISQDIVRGYTRKGISPRCLLKLDLQKAFDSVRWSFIKQLLQSLHFPTIFVDWIMACLQATSFTIYIHGKKGSTLPAGKGLKQGDPLSPLFLSLPWSTSHTKCHYSALRGNLHITLDADLYSSRTLCLPTMSCCSAKPTLPRYKASCRSYVTSSYVRASKQTKLSPKLFMRGAPKH
ncbi:hypothetical protein Cgig2_018474 [Carnegiea gigantea]|uniref:Reverse transcriptase domain-containing protein n=1 Tax=Carnegiea gigantea TaxID=171969 RepID=A0A9Q1GUI2_9CARY|nr:hypothetical protein Cgig2_018474 [Carnegiea gigantea]